jgi:hypothetical protein
MAVEQAGPGGTSIGTCVRGDDKASGNRLQFDQLVPICNLISG